MIDCNGTWIRIDGSPPAVKTVKWHWMDKPAGKFLGRYKYDENRDAYELVRSDGRPKIEEIYQLKDPEHPLSSVE